MSDMSDVNSVSVDEQLTMTIEETKLLKELVETALEVSRGGPKENRKEKTEIMARCIANIISSKLGIYRPDMISRYNDVF